MVTGLAVAIATIAFARGGSQVTGCGHGRTLPERGHDYDLPRLGPLSLQAGFRGDFVHGYPYKVGITRHDMSQRTIVVRGWRCADGRPLHFFYRDLRYFPLPKPPLTTRQLQRLGDSAARLPWYQAPPGQSALGYSGYMLSGRTGTGSSRCSRATASSVGSSSASEGADLAAPTIRTRGLCPCVRLQRPVGPAGAFGTASEPPL